MRNGLKRNRIKEGSAAVDSILSIAAIIICLVTVYPMYYVIIKSISDPALSLARPVTLYPQGLYFGSYSVIVQDMRMWVAYGNTIIYVAGGTLLMLISSVAGAYPLIIRNLAGRKWVVRFLLVPMYFGGGLIPFFLLVKDLGMYDSRLSMILPGAVGIMNIILTRTYFTTIPGSLSESAKIDGASHIKILMNIYVPLSKPILAVIAIYTIVGIWNSWFNAMIFLTTPEKHPLQMYLQRLLVAQTVDLKSLRTADEIRQAQDKALTAIQLKYAMIVFVTLPILFVYPMFQKHFMKGFMLGSLKA